MKKLLLISALLLTVATSYAQVAYYQLMKSSFSGNDSVLVGSTQWCDVKLTGQGGGAFETLQIAIKNPSTFNSALVVNTQFQYAAVKNADGITYRITFKMPVNYMLGTFGVSITKCDQTYSGILTDKITTGIEDVEYDTKAIKTYYDVLGNQVTPTEGVYIWRDNKGGSGKVFISQ